MNDDEQTIIVRDDGDVQVILLNRPSAANALDGAMLDALGRALYAVSTSPSKAVVIAGNGRNFCAGSDLTAALAKPDEMTLRGRFHPVILALDALPKPVVAAVNGAAAGGGLALALMADMRILGKSARFIPAWVSLGLVPDLGASWHLAKALGPAQAFEWLVKSVPMTANEARDRGLANDVVPDGNELQAAIATARNLATIPGPALALTRQLLRQAAGNTLSEQLEAEARGQELAMRDPDQIAALAARVAQLNR